MRRIGGRTLASLFQSRQPFGQGSLRSWVKAIDCTVVGVVCAPTIRGTVGRFVKIHDESECLAVRRCSDGLFVKMYFDGTTRRENFWPEKGGPSVPTEGRPSILLLRGCETNGVLCGITALEPHRLPKC